MKFIELLGNCSGSADKAVIQKLCYSAGFYISQCAIHFYDLFAKYRNCMKNIASGKMVAFGPSIGQKFKNILAKA